MNWMYDDGGRADAGFKGETGDCVVRAIAIATRQPYREVYDELHTRALANRPYMAKLELVYGAQARRHASPRTGVNKKVYRPYLESLGWYWTPTRGIGTGTQVHLRTEELPPGRVITEVSRHVVAVIDGVVHDTCDPSRDGTRCVYGYWRPQRSCWCDECAECLEAMQ
jgi:hypothetical protein